MNPKKLISLVIIAAHVFSIALPPNVFAGEFSVFNKIYFRESGAPKTITDNFDVINPSTAWALRAINGDLEDDAIEKVSSSTLNLNGIDILQANQFNQNVNFIEVPVTLSSSNTVITELRSKPGGQLVIEIVGEDNDPPVISNITPANSLTVSDAQPTISANYNDILSGIDINTVKLILDSNDVTGESTVTSSQVSFTPSSPLSDGQHTANFEVADNAMNLALAQTTFTVPASTVPPVLDPIGNQSVDVGTTLSIQLSATDANNDPLTFSASPLPLPNNATLNAITGQFSFSPDDTQVGQINITFRASDGLLTDSESIIITVNPVDPGGVTRLTGRLLDTNDFVQGFETPIVGAVVSLLNTGFTTTSDNNGFFTLTGIPAGSRIFDINPTNANPAPDGSPYAGFREEIQIIGNVTNVVDRPFFLPRIATESLTTVDPSLTTIVENPTLGITMTVPPFTARAANGTFFTGDLSISEVPDGLAPAALPEELQPGLLITIQPVGVTFDTPVPITFPNTDSILPGNELNLWSLDPETGTFVIVGNMLVNANSVDVDTVSGGIRAADWHFVLSPPVDLELLEPAVGLAQDQKKCDKCQTASENALLTGELSEEHNLASYRSFGQTRSLTLNYGSLRADPRPIIRVDSTMLRVAGVPPTTSTKLTVGGVE